MKDSSSPQDKMPLSLWPEHQCNYKASGMRLSEDKVCSESKLDSHVQSIFYIYMSSPIFKYRHVP